MSTELRHLRAFVAAVEMGSINRAASHLHCTQPSLSQQIRQLEDELGGRLLERQPRGVAPTALGRGFYARAADILARLDLARREAASWADGAAGVLRIGLIPTLSKGVLPSVLPAFTAEHPQVELHVLEAYTGTLIDAVLADELDCAVVISPRGERALTRRLLARDTLVIIAGPAAALRRGRAVRLAELPPQKLVLPSARHSLRNAVDRFVEGGALAIARSIEIDGLLATLQFVRESDFIALLPRMTVADEGRDGRLRVVPIADPVAQFDYSLVHRRRQPPGPHAAALVARIEAALKAG